MKDVSLAVKVARFIPALPFLIVGMLAYIPHFCIPCSWLDHDSKGRIRWYAWPPIAIGHAFYPFLHIGLWIAGIED